MYLFIFLVFILSILNLISSNIFVWWSVFLLMTLIFIMLNKGFRSFSSMLNYFIMQESLGLLFLFFGFGLLQFLILLMKIGVAPLHFWVFSVTNNLINFGLMWFLTFQKLPFLPVVMYLFSFSFLFLFIAGVMFCYYQLLLSKSFKNMIILSSIESFNWIIFVCFLSLMNVFYLFIYYMFLMVMFIPSLSGGDYNFINWETIVVFMNIPFSVTFFVKIFSLSSVLLLSELFVLLVLFSMFLSMLCFSFWLVTSSTKDFMWYSDNNKSYYFFILPMMMMSVI